MYIPRSLIASKGTQDERIVKEAEIPALGRVVVLLGEPGIGKTELTKQLSLAFGATRVAAGTFCRSSDVSVYAASDDRPIIIDGLDEIAASSTEPAIDKILGKLSGLQNPNVIISCRAADWTGATNRAKFQSDYGVAPVPVHILPFSAEQAKEFVSAYSDQIDADTFLHSIDRQALSDLIGNPLTLSLLAEIWEEDGGLPETKVELLDRGTALLASEENLAHDQSAHANISTPKILESAGCIFAHLLLSGSVGISINNQRRYPEDFIPLASFDFMDVNASTILKTRLFKPDLEDQLVPVHKIVAEFLAARWLSQKLDEKLSERRLFQLLQFNGGVPSALRGLHAWLGFFSQKVRDRCIDLDPYGFLRYGETTALNPQSARHLLNALAKLADDDPYFRSEDWSVRSVSGFARPELKAEIVALISSPQRHVQLSALILESLSGSELTNEIVPELIGLIMDAEAPFVERKEASEALAKSNLKMNWQNLIDDLLKQHKHDSWRLAVETIGYVGPAEFSADVIANALIALKGFNESERRESRSFGSDYKLIREISIETAKSVLDCISMRIEDRYRPRHWHLGRGITSVVERLLACAIDGSPIEPKRFWTWLKYIEGRFSSHEKQKNKIRDYLLINSEFRREVQRIVLYDEAVDGGPWMAIVHELPRTVPGLSISIEDAIYFLKEIATTSQPTEFQVVLWEDLVRATWRRGHENEKLQQVIDLTIQHHPSFAAIFEEVTQPPAKDYEAEQRARQERYEKKRQTRFAKHRSEFTKYLPQIASGQQLGVLLSLARGYLGRYSDLPSDVDPHARLIAWVGDEIAQVASQGFVAALESPDLPGLEKILSSRAEGKRWDLEDLILVGIAEVVRSDGSLRNVKSSVTRAALCIWWEMPEFNSKLGDQIEKRLEEVVFTNDDKARAFVSAIIEPQIRAGKQHVTGLYRFAREQAFLSFSPRLALEWLQRYPTAVANTQSELIQLLIGRTDRTGLASLIEQRVDNIDTLDAECQFLWLAAAFCFNPCAMPPARPILKEMIWTVKDLVLPDRTERSGYVLPVERYVAIVETFALDWPMVGHPTGGWSGDKNPRDACEFISYCINAIGADRTGVGTEALERLIRNLNATGYSSHLKHVAQEQKRNRRDEEYPVQTFHAVKGILSNSTPATVVDLKFVILDHLFDIQKYVRDSDTKGWEVFWDRDRPKVENTCRDRLLDFLRPRLTGSIELFPELPMPDSTRVDIYASFLGQGLPIEIKGQWHPELWDAPKTQLDERYCRDWRTDGRGIYLIIWFGKVVGKDLTPNPSGAATPTTPMALREQVVQALGEGEKARIDVFVLDVSKPAK